MLMLTDENLHDLLLDRAYIEDSLYVCAQVASQFFDSAHEKNGSHRQYIEEEQRDRKEETTYPFALAASYYCQAASHSVLIYERTRRDEFFRKAAMSFSLMGLPYRLNMASFLKDNYVITDDDRREYLNALEAFNPLELSDPLEIKAQYVYSLLAFLDFQPRNQDEEHIVRVAIDRLQNVLQYFRRFPIGILGIPVSRYLDVVNALNPYVRSQVDLLEQALLPFITRYDDALHEALEDQYHWQQLALDFHPAEPDVIGVLVRTLSILRLRRSGMRVLDFIQKLPISKKSRIMLVRILEDYL
jgi:hypothetical protein